MVTIEQLNPDRVGYKHKTNRQRFWALVDKNGSNGCWEWLGSRSVRYGRFTLEGGRKVTSHRYSFYLINGYFPKDDEYVCHKCDNTYCVNPEHLFLGTQFDNMQDMIQKGRKPDVSGENNPQAKLSQKEVDTIRFLRSIGIPRKALSVVYGVGVNYISRIASYELWKSNDGSS